MYNQIQAHFSFLRFINITFQILNFCLHCTYTMFTLGTAKPFCSRTVPWNSSSTRSHYSSVYGVAFKKYVLIYSLVPQA